MNIHFWSIISSSKFHRLCVWLIYTFWYVNMPNVFAGYERFSDSNGVSHLINSVSVKKLLNSSDRKLVFLNFDHCIVFAWKVNLFHDFHKWVMYNNCMFKQSKEMLSTRVVCICRSSNVFYLMQRFLIGF